jgi:hypothetical protein
MLEAAARGGYRKAVHWSNINSKKSRGRKNSPGYPEKINSTIDEKKINLETPRSSILTICPSGDVLRKTFLLMSGVPHFHFALNIISTCLGSLIELCCRSVGNGFDESENNYDCLS